MSKPSRLLNILLAVVISLFFVSSTYTQTITVNKLAEPPIQWPRSHQFDMQHMSLKLSFDWDKETVFGEATLKLTPFANELKTVELDATKFKVDSEKLSSGTNLKHQVTEQKILVTLDRVYKPNEIISFTVKYSAQPKLGLVFIKPTKTDPTRPFQIWSQGETETNREWFPCYDSPNDRATSETIVTMLFPMVS